MKVYVDFEELDVEDRPTYICNKYNLQVKSINSGTRYDNVKLVSLAEHTKQVRKEVCEEIRNKLKENGLLYTWKGEPKYKTMEELLDRIQAKEHLKLLDKDKKDTI
jgi:hypothetical protein